MNQTEIIWGDEDLKGKDDSLQYMLIRVYKSTDSYCGYLRIANHDGEYFFSGLDELLLQIARLCPQKGYQLRTIGKPKAGNNWQETKPASDMEGDYTAFAIKPYQWKQFSMQGQLIYPKEQSKVFFRSELELLSLMHSALEKSSAETAVNQTKRKRKAI